MKLKKSSNKKLDWKAGFTLIELLMVVSIISLLSSIVLAGVTVARGKASDAKKEVESSEVATGIQSYISDHGGAVAPPNFYDGTYNSGGVSNPANAKIAFEDVNNPTNPQTPGGKAYKASMQALIDGGYISSIPHSPDPNTPYGYFNYGQGTPGGAVFMSQLSSAPPSTTGLGNSCRPNTPPTYVESMDTCIGADHSVNGQCEIDFTYSNGTVCSGVITYSAGSSSGGFDSVVNSCTGPTNNMCDTTSNTSYCLCNSY